MFAIFSPDAVLCRIVGYMMEVLRQNWQIFLQRGILTAILGLLSVFWPAAMIPTLLLMLGAYVYCEEGWTALQNMMPGSCKARQVGHAVKPVEEPPKNADHGPSAISMMAFLALLALQNDQGQAQQKLSGVDHDFQRSRGPAPARLRAEETLLKPMHAKRPHHVGLLLRKLQRPKTEQPSAATTHAP